MQHTSDDSAHGRAQRAVVYTTSTGWHVHLLDTLPALERYAERHGGWLPASNPFCDGAVAIRWFAQRPAGVQPFVLGIESPEGRPAGLAAWCIRRNRWGVRSLTGLNGRDAWYHEPTLAAAPAAEQSLALQALAEALRHWRRRFDLVEIEVRADDPTGLLAALRPLGAPFLFQDRWRQHPTSELRRGPDGTEVTDFSHLRKKERRHWRKLEAVPHRFYCVPPEEFAEQLERLRSWQTSRYAQARDWQSYHMFMQAVVEVARSHDGALLHALEIEGQTAALDLTLKCGKWAFGLLLSYDEAYKSYSPGNLLVLHLLEHLPDLGVWHLDEGPGSQVWKERLASSTLGISQVMLPTSPVGWTLALHKAKLMPWLKQRESLRKLYARYREAALSPKRLGGRPRQTTQAPT